MHKTNSTMCHWGADLRHYDCKNIKYSFMVKQTVVMNKLI